MVETITTKISKACKSLPPEMVEKIIKFLNYKAICQAQLVCRNWRDIIVNGNLVKKAKGKNFKPFIYTFKLQSSMYVDFLMLFQQIQIGGFLLEKISWIIIAGGLDRSFIKRSWRSQSAYSFDFFGSSNGSNSEYTQDFSVPNQIFEF